MIQSSIEMISHRFNVLLDLIRFHGLDLDSTFRNEQKKFQIKITELHHKLTNWELQHVGEQTFSKAFEPLIDNIMVQKAKTNGLKNPTVTGRARQVQLNKQVGGGVTKKPRALGYIHGRQYGLYKQGLESNLYPPIAEQAKSLLNLDSNRGKSHKHSHNITSEPTSFRPNKQLLI